MIQRIGRLCLMWGYTTPRGVKGYGVGIEGGAGHGIVYVGGWQISIMIRGWNLTVGLPLEPWTPWTTRPTGRMRCAIGPFALSRPAKEG